MAGYIHISEDVGSSMGSHQFREIISLARTHLSLEDENKTEELYEYFDTTGECLIILKDIDSEIFTIFSKTIQLTIDNDLIDRDEAVKLAASDLIEKLSADPRYGAKNSL